jgi:hypothetical protein
MRENWGREVCAKNIPGEKKEKRVKPREKGSGWCKTKRAMVV